MIVEDIISYKEVFEASSASYPGLVHVGNMLRGWLVIHIPMTCHYKLEMIPRSTSKIIRFLIVRRDIKRSILSFGSHHLKLRTPSWEWLLLEKKEREYIVTLEKPLRFPIWKLETLCFFPWKIQKRSHVNPSFKGNSGCTLYDSSPIASRPCTCVDAGRGRFHSQSLSQGGNNSAEGCGTL